MILLYTLIGIGFVVIIGIQIYLSYSYIEILKQREKSNVYNEQHNKLINALDCISEATSNYVDILKIREHNVEVDTYIERYIKIIDIIDRISDASWSIIYKSKILVYITSNDVKIPKKDLIAYKNEFFDIWQKTAGSAIYNTLVTFFGDEEVLVRMIILDFDKRLNAYVIKNTYAPNDINFDDVV